MFRHVTLSSIISSFVGSLFFVIICLSTYGSAAIIFGLIAFPCALAWCLLFSYPLIKLTGSLAEKYRVLMFLVVGFVSGAGTPLILGNIELINFMQAKELLFTYGSLGAVTSLAAWWYVRKYVPR